MGLLSDIMSRSSPRNTMSVARDAAGDWGIDFAPPDGLTFNAAEIGHESESAFSTAFNRVRNMRPREVELAGQLANLQHSHPNSSENGLVTAMESWQLRLIHWPVRRVLRKPEWVTMPRLFPTSSCC